MGDTAISWTDETWNPVRGCQRVSEGCRHCYAERQAVRIVRMGKGKPTPYDNLVKLVNGEPRWTGAVSLDPERLAAPLSWRTPRRVFVDSMSDLFYDGRSNEDIAAVFGVMAATQHITYQVLTKYARRMRDWFAWADGWPARTPAELTTRAHGPSVRERIEESMRAALNGVVDGTPRRRDRSWPLPNVWIGVSVENQDAADERIPDLLQTPAAVRLLSCEPMLGGINFYDVPDWRKERGISPRSTALSRIDWVIAGCESGAGARPCDVRWLRSLRDQCSAAGVPFFLKQARATYLTQEEFDADYRDSGDGCAGATRPIPIHIGEGSRRKPGGVIELPYLDGVKHDAFPQLPTEIRDDVQQAHPS